MIVMDASAILAYLRGEPGADVVEKNVAGAVIGAANWSEVLQKLRFHGADWELAVALMDALGLVVEPVSAVDAQRAAQLWRRESGLSLGDRLCLALADRLDAVALTADKAWGVSDRIQQIR